VATQAAEMRRLLRTLDDPVAMSRNRLVCSLFHSSRDLETFRRIRAAVMEAVEMLGSTAGARPDIVVHRERQYAIVKRYDLGDARMEDVLRALCIERSQFYRERVHALTWLAEWMKFYVDETSADGNGAFEPGTMPEDRLEEARQLLRMAEINIETDRRAARARAAEAVRILDAAS
jgi:hypothetical protein